jgi:hypothetical protein
MTIRALDSAETRAAGIRVCHGASRNLELVAARSLHRIFAVGRQAYYLNAVANDPIGGLSLDTFKIAI